MNLTKKKKREIIEKLKDLIGNSKVIGILDMHGMPAKQLQEIKKEMKNLARIKMARKSLINIALDESEEEKNKKGINKLKENSAMQPALIFGDKNPFKLYKKIKEKKSPAPASGGETAPKDISVPKGPTGIGPGPMIGELKKIGADVKVEDGEIIIQNTITAIREGDTITKEEADILNRLGIKPLEIGLDLKLAYEEGTIYDKSILDIDVGEFKEKVKDSIFKSINLAVNIGYPTPETTPIIIRNAVNRARNLSINANIISKENIEEVICKSRAEAEYLYKKYVR